MTVEQSHDARSAYIFRRFCMLTLALAVSLASHCVAFGASDGMGPPSADLAFVHPFSSRTKSFSRDTRGWFGVVKPLVTTTGGGALGSGSSFGETSRSSRVEQDATPGKRTRIPSRPSTTRPASSSSGITMAAANIRRPKIIIAGAPASGKGTQCSLIKERYGVVHLSTGDMLREAVKNETPVGLKAKGFMNEGKLVPDDVIIDIVRSRLEEKDCQIQGWLLDGFPRTRAQADALAAAGIKADSFLLLNVPDEMLITRVVGRRLDPETGDIYHLDFNPPPPEIVDRLVHRADDTAEKAQVRLDTYHNNIAAIKECYEDITCSLDGSVGKAQVFEKITAELDSKLEQSGKVAEKATEPIEGMKPGTSGLRKKD